MACLLTGNENYICGNDSHWVVYQNIGMEKLCGVHINWGKGIEMLFWFLRTSLGDVITWYLKTPCARPKSVFVFSPLF